MATQDIATAAALSTTNTRDIATAGSLELEYIYQDVATQASIWVAGCDPSLFWPTSTDITYAIGHVRQGGMPNAFANHSANQHMVIASIHWTVTCVYGDGIATIAAEFDRELKVEHYATYYGGLQVTNEEFLDALVAEADRIRYELFPVTWTGASDSGASITAASEGGGGSGGGGSNGGTTNIWNGASVTSTVSLP